MKLRSETLAWAALAISAASCGRPAPPRASYVPVAELEAVYGPLFATANHPTPNQYGTGDRLGLFRDGTGTVWGLPLAMAGDGAVLGCAPPGLRDAPVTDTLPVRSEDLIGGTNAPTGWRGGTGELELVFRNKSGQVEWRAVKSSALATGPVCWAQEPPGPQQRLEYYRLTQAPR
jgi:hypothetical protein